MKKITRGQELPMAQNNGAAASAGAALHPRGPGTYNHFLGANGITGIPRPQSGLMSRREAAHYLGITATTLAIWKSTGRYTLPFVRIGRLIKYRQSDLDVFIENNLNAGPMSA